MIHANVDYFTVVRFLGVGKYDRHERGSLEEAIDLGMELAVKAQRDYMIYAVAGSHDTFICGVRYAEAKKGMRPNVSIENQATAKSKRRR